MVQIGGTIRMSVHLGFPWSLCGVLSVLPQPWLDRLYALIARNRLRWFGSQSVCFLADPDHRDRFIA
jgi:predicted DCC family thiol-disulfide oxidoreductase YuxK